MPHNGFDKLLSVLYTSLHAFGMPAFQTARSCHCFMRTTLLGTIHGPKSPRVLLRQISCGHDKELILTRKSGVSEGVMHLELNRPKANALSKDLVDKLSMVLEDISMDKSVRALVLSSNVKGVFCAGADLKERINMPVEEVGTFVASLRSLMSQISSLPAPTIAAMEGAAFGGGLEMALACDLRVAGEGAVMGLTETSLGIIPGAGGTQRLPRLIGASPAKELIFTAQRVDASKALTLGLVNRVVQAGFAVEEAMSMATEIAKRGPAAVRLAKEAVDRGM
ncbi:unnamed protein product, partial [Choristocarpus tenellus]